VNYLPIVLFLVFRWSCMLRRAVCKLVLPKLWNNKPLFFPADAAISCMRNFNTGSPLYAPQPQFPVATAGALSSVVFNSIGAE